jgi:glycosyltransferase involved in cell wall biosynthesis
MASGLPVVSTTAGGIPEVVLHGRPGLLARAGDAAAIADLLAALLRDAALRARLGRAGRELAAERFDVRRSALRMAEIVAAKELVA